MSFTKLFSVLVLLPFTSQAGTSLLTLEGRDSRSQRVCKLEVVGLENLNGQQTALVTTSYTHSGEAPEAIRVGTSPDRADVLAGLGQNGRDQIAIFLSEAGFDLTKATSFNFRWWHRNHFDNFRCQNLKVTFEQPEDDHDHDHEHDHN